MKDRDDELESLLSGVGEDPSEIELARWKRAARTEALRIRAARARRWAPVAAALAVGFLLGAVSMRERAHPMEAEYSSDSATVVSVYAKSE